MWENGPEERTSVTSPKVSAVKTWLYQLARELNMDAHGLLAICNQKGMPVKNILTKLDEEQCEAVRRLVELMREEGQGNWSDPE